jgi:undecaprenyl-diphosphatase
VLTSQVMTELTAIILLGLIEGLTEFLPVSSTGHLLLAEHYLPAQSDLFNTVIQSGAVCAVLVLFGGRVKNLLTSLHTPETRRYLSQLAVAFSITAVGGLALKKAHFKLPEETSPVAWATLIGGILFVAVELGLKNRKQVTQSGISWAVAVSMGAGQLIAAIFPGASRSGSTILLALLLGAGRPQATEFSFLLGIPTLLAAGGVQTLSALKDGTGQENWLHVGIAAAVAAVTAFVVVRWLLDFVRNNTFLVFGAYRIVLGIIMLLLA